MENYLDELSRDFVALASESIAEIQDLIDRLDKHADVAEEALRRIKHLTHTLKGNGGTFGYPNISLIAHRVEDFIVHAGPATARDGLHRFYDRMEDVLSDRMPRDGNAEVVMAGLPRAVSFDLSDIVRQEVDVVLVMENMMQARLVRREFEACGYSVLLIPNTLQALDYVHRVKPDLIVASALMPGLSGVELLVALKALKATRDIPCALLTSLASNDHDLDDLPKQVPVIRKGREFSDQLASALAQLKIT